jgi:hypothetical protein
MLGAAAAVASPRLLDRIGTPAATTVIACFLTLYPGPQASVPLIRRLRSPLLSTADFRAGLVSTKP